MDGNRDGGLIVVGVDASDSAREAAEWAADLASAERAPLLLVHVVPGGYQDAPITPIPAWLAELRDVAVRLGAEPCVAEVQPGTPVDVLGTRAEGAAMLVLGSYGEAGWSGMLAGTVAVSLLERVRCPVAVIRGKVPQLPPPRGGPVVVGVDGSPAGRAALDVAAGLAEVLGARLVGTRAWSDVVAGSDGSAHRRPEDWPVLADEAGRMLAAELGRVAAAHPELVIEHDVDEDTPLRVLLDRAGTARMIVVGHRRTAPQTGMPQTGMPQTGMLLGSTSRALVEFAECPVVVVGPAMVAAEPAAGGLVPGDRQGFSRGAPGRAD
ncbi:universal stress protein [Pseudonocardia abyssalis]|uniref:Universal stress protein n=1 Tax=Pseudonocardia abyssalis TaxID=2792008 RepID=A0ABS6UNE8_9PSEU|nr:universal stress protein [Pseudonocardia abyssalis]MBW0116576.1 universal stress protein [Pseudonocardia abyssalis]MBW0133778.1 universal stress protein [Pseudonocardia abyssalis]